jgi:hypothetical protein
VTHGRASSSLACGTSNKTGLNPLNIRGSALLAFMPIHWTLIGTDCHGIALCRRFFKLFQIEKGVDVPDAIF